MDNLTYITYPLGKYITEINENEIADYNLLGVAVALSLDHAVYLALKNKDNFWDNVVAYRITKSEKSEIFNRGTGRNDYISVEFYEQK